MKTRWDIVWVALLLASPAWAQTLPAGGSAAAGALGAGPAIAAASAAGGFAALSPGDQEIARALFEAQTPPPAATAAAAGPTPMNLDQIAALKASGGWGQAFKEMQSDGLVQEQNLGAVVSGYERQVHGVGGIGHGEGLVLLTNAGGRTTALMSAGAHSMGAGAHSEGHGAGPSEIHGH